MLDFGLARQYTNTTGDVRPVSITAHGNPGLLTCSLIGGPFPRFFCSCLSRTSLCSVSAAPNSRSTLDLSPFSLSLGSWWMPHPYLVSVCPFWSKMDAGAGGRFRNGIGVPSLFLIRLVWGWGWGEARGRHGTGRQSELKQAKTVSVSRVDMWPRSGAVSEVPGGVLPSAASECGRVSRDRSLCLCQCPQEPGEWQSQD